MLLMLALTDKGAANDLENFIDKVKYLELNRL
jgi:hypothetical protein